MAPIASLTFSFTFAAPIFISLDWVDSNSALQTVTTASVQIITV